ncbi:diguanylate cyclase [Marinobacter sp. 1_MG-2023]|uniref:diguanylate cyclase n=1 Tax=Marinobacter sp. 1_MG-2023 TaxID=3062627 RepID=UPI0026E3F585|nr:diguanylate cyclase [Marinobacter sp. 1_MG-2023]MDO6823107.1 diguanylate cyclase [Marinobacter sp. 1_MG-2023]
MPHLSLEFVSSEWLALNEKFPSETHQFVRGFFQNNASILSEYFYQVMLSNPEASKFLSNEDVQQRLGNSMQRWLSGLFGSSDQDSVFKLIAEQRKIGEVHARIDIPLHLVLRGARCLKNQFTALIDDGLLSDKQRVLAIHLASDTIDLAMEVMGQAYSLSHDRNSRAEEAYRLFAITQNIANEKDQQRAAVLHWENQLMFGQAVGKKCSELPRIQTSEFGLWFRHKGAHAFEGSVEATAILDAMDAIDHTVLPLFGAGGHDLEGQAKRVSLLHDLRDNVRSILFHLDSLFEQSNELESGRDVLTRLLNRKFMPVVLTRQIDQARKQDTCFGVVALDIDHFKQVNDTYGHQAGDVVLQQLALILLNNSRSGDYLFRMGGEEFLLVAVDINKEQVQRLVEKLRVSVERELFRLPEENTLRVTISAGVSCFDGHPDYQRLIRKADDALYQAKSRGRNRVVIA